MSIEYECIVIDKPIVDITKIIKGVKYCLFSLIKNFIYCYLL